MTTETLADAEPLVYPRHPFIADSSGDGGCGYCGGGEPEDERHSEPFERTLAECVADMEEDAIAEHPFVDNPDEPGSCLSCTYGRDFAAHPPTTDDAPQPEPMVKPAPISLADALQRVAEREKKAAEANAALTVAKANAKGAEELLKSAFQVLREAAEREVSPELPMDESPL